MKRHSSAIRNIVLSGVAGSFVAASLLPADALAGASQRKGHNPNGKPFVELAGTIVEIEGEISSLQDQVDSLVGRVETIEDAQVAMQAAITDLEAENAALQAQIDANAADVASLEAQISQLNSEIMVLEQDIADLGDADGSLQAQIDAHEASITTLALSIDTLEGNLQATIDNNTALIAQMQQQIDSIQSAQEFYQLLVSGSCPAGQAIRSVGADGSVVCEVINGNSAVSEYRVTKFAGTAANGSATATATCPADYVLTGGGFLGNFGSSSELGGGPGLAAGFGVVSSDAAANRSYTAKVAGAQYAGFLTAQAICLKFN